MHQQTIIVVLIGLAVSTYGLDLSHAAKNPNKLDPRTVNLVTNLYAQMISPPINHLFANLAVLGNHILAEVSKNGIPTANGRTLHPSEEQLRGFFGGLWNDALKPPIENALSGVSLMLAQVLAGVGLNGVNLGIGKRDLTEEEMRGFFDALGQAVNDVFSNVIQKPLENALAGGALMLAQVLAGVGTNGVNLSDLLGKRDVIDLSGHEAELRGIIGTIGGAVVNGLTGVWNNVFQVPLENLVQNTALTAAGWLATLGTEGVNLGKRSTNVRGEFFNNLFEHATGLYTDQVKPIVENALNNAALHLASILANYSQNNIGRR